MAEMSCTDFVDAVQYLQDRWNSPDVVCHYLAALRYEVHLLPYRIFGPPENGKPMPKLKDFMLKFSFDKKPEAAEEKDEGADLEAGIEKMMRLFNDKKVRPKPPPKPKRPRPPKRKR